MAKIMEKVKDFLSGKVVFKAKRCKKEEPKVKPEESQTGQKGEAEKQ